MGKLFTPQDISSGFNTTNSLNTNFDNIETALDRTLSRYADTPNAMESDLDMNNNDLINAGLVSCDTLEVGGAEIPTLQSLQDLLDATESDLQDQVDLAQGFATTASQSASDAVTAQGLAEAAQAAAEAAVGSLNLPIVGSGDTGKILRVNGAEDGYELTAALLDGEVTAAKLAPALFLTGNVSLSVETSPSGATEFGSITEAVDFVRTNYIPAGGTVTITWNKKDYNNTNDRLVVAAGEDLSYVTVRLTTGTYLFGSAPTMFAVGKRARAPLVQAVGTATLASGVILAAVNEGGYLQIAGGTINLSTGATTIPLQVDGGVVDLDGLTLSITSTGARCISLSGGGALAWDLATSISLTTTSSAASAIEASLCSRISGNGPLTINASGGSVDGIRINSRSSLLLGSFTATMAGGKIAVRADNANIINLTGSAASCNLTDYTVSADGILIR